MHKLVITSVYYVVFESVYCYHTQVCISLTARLKEYNQCNDLL